MKRSVPHIVDRQGNTIRWDDLSALDKSALQQTINTIGSRFPVSTFNIVKVEDDEKPEAVSIPVMEAKPITETKPVYQNSPIFPEQHVESRTESVTVFKVYRDDFKSCATYQLDSALQVVAGTFNNFACNALPGINPIILSIRDCPSVQMLTELWHFDPKYQGPYVITPMILGHVAAAISNWIGQVIGAVVRDWSMSNNCPTPPSFDQECELIMKQASTVVIDALSGIYTRAQSYIGIITRMGVDPDSVKFNYCPF